MRRWKGYRDGRYRGGSAADAEPGRLKIKMADMLTAAGFPTWAEDVWVQVGGYRTHSSESRWGATARDGKPLSCWDTMAECAKSGIEIERFPSDGFWTICLADGTKPHV